MGVEGQHRPVVDGLADLRDALRGAFEEQVHEFLQHADAVGGRHVAQLGDDGLVEQVVGRAGLRRDTKAVSDFLVFMGPQRCSADCSSPTRTGLEM